jgi:hypothetical protein
VYGDGTYYLRNVQSAPFQTDVDRVNYFNNPLQLRVNGGADWTFGSVTLSANAQYFGRYRIFPPTVPAFQITQATSLQGGAWIAPQVYVDLHANWRHRMNLAGATRDIEIDLGIIDVFDQAPPRESSFSLDEFSSRLNSPNQGYSRYGDPRQRRFVLTLGMAF